MPQTSKQRRRFDPFRDEAQFERAKAIWKDLRRTDINALMEIESAMGVTLTAFSARGLFGARHP